MTQTEATGDHRQNCYRHAVKRARERYGLALLDADLALIEAAIKAGKGQWLSSDAERMTITYAVAFKERVLVVVFDPQLDCIRTFLPAHADAFLQWRPKRRGEAA